MKRFDDKTIQDMMWQAARPFQPTFVISCRQENPCDMKSVFETMRQQFSYCAAIRYQDGVFEEFAFQTIIREEASYIKPFLATLGLACRKEELWRPSFDGVDAAVRKVFAFLEGCGHSEGDVLDICKKDDSLASRFPLRGWRRNV